MYISLLSIAWNLSSRFLPFFSLCANLLMKADLPPFILPRLFRAYPTKNYIDDTEPRCRATVCIY